LSLPEVELKELMLRSLDGDAGAYRRLLAALSDRLGVYFGRRLRGDAAQVEDLVQETLLAIHAKRATFDRTQLVSAWAYAIARYKLIDHLRRTSRAGVRPFEPGEDFAAKDESAAAEARRDIEAGLATLPGHTRELLIRVKLHEEPVADVARRAGMSEGAVKVAVHRGFLKLAARLRGKDGGK
jgi:RNA polymerase sigma-70 factor (ECF subfamily)